MKTVLPVLFVFVLAGAAASAAAEGETGGFPGVPAPPRLDVRSYALIDYDSGAVLAEFNAHERAEPASLTKIMTTYVAADALANDVIALDDLTTVSEKAWRMGGSRMFIEVGKQVSVDDLLQGIIVQSGNDASVALAEHISGSEDVFASVMNEHAARMGMKNSSFANSTGLPDPSLYSTAYDLTVLGRHLIRDFPDIYARFAIPEFTYGGITQRNRNRLLTRDASADGIKTGHTEAAGYCLVSSAKREGMRLVSAVMGAKSDGARTEASQALLNYGFRFFESRKVAAAGDTITTAKVWKGKADTVALGVESDLAALITRGKYSDLKAEAEIDEPVIAPLEKGQQVGQVVLKLAGKTISTHPLVALVEVPEASIISRAIDEVLLWFE